MILPEGTKLSLTVVCCTGLKKLTAEDCGLEHREVAQQDFDRAQANLQEAFQAAAQATPETLPRAQQTVQRANRQLAHARSRLRATPDGEIVETPPNPFVIVTVDEYNRDASAILFTRVIRACTSPIWKDTFENFPLAAHLRFRQELVKFDGGDPTFTPRALVFSIYHDDALPDCNDHPPVDCDLWKRELPRRSRLIGRASWDFDDIRRKLYCPTFERNLDVIDPCNGRKIREAKLTIRAQLIAERPNVLHAFRSMFCSERKKRYNANAGNVDVPHHCCRREKCHHCN